MRTATSFQSSRRIFLAILAVTAATALVQSSPSASGIQLSTFDVDVGQNDIRFPLAITQCEPVLIYYNMASDGYRLNFLTPDLHEFLSIPVPSGAGYIEWTCNIPRGYGLVARNYRQYYLVVKPGRQSSCLRNLTTTYPSASYVTSVFASYTGHPPSTTSPHLLSSSLASSTVPFPTGAFSTITVNPDLHLAPRISSCSTKSQSIVLAGSVLGGVFLGLAIAFGAFLVYFRRLTTHLQDQ